MPAVTVLIPAHNAAATLAQTLDSLVAQTYRDFDVLIINDASADNTAELALSYRQQLAIEVVTLTENAGVAGALNHGLALIESPYIARLDADDMAFPQRLERQMAFLEANRDIAVCSSAMQMFFDDGKATEVLTKPQHDATIKTALLQYSALSHTASTFRKSFFDDVGVFDTRVDFAEDYDLWTRGALLGKRYTNLPDVLTHYRRHANSVSVQKMQLQYERDLIIKRKYITALLDGDAPDNLAEFFSLMTSFTSQEVAITVVEQSLPLLLKLGRRVPDPALFAEIVSKCIGRHLRNK
jgi:glycosyltransferase involved in cell wall biosynthesis